MTYGDYVIIDYRPNVVCIPVSKWLKSSSCTSRIDMLPSPGGTSQYDLSAWNVIQTIWRWSRMLVRHSFAFSNYELYSMFRAIQSLPARYWGTVALLFSTSIIVLTMTSNVLLDYVFSPRWLCVQLVWEFDVFIGNLRLIAQYSTYTIIAFDFHVLPFIAPGNDR